MKHGTLQVRVRRRWLLMPRWNHGFVQIMQIILVIRIMHIIPVVQAMQIMQSMLAILIVQAMHCDTKEQRRSLSRPRCVWLGVSSGCSVTSQESIFSLLVRSRDAGLGV